MDVEIDNQSSLPLENAEARFDQHACKWGHVGKTFAAIYMFFPHPITTQAELHWDEAGRHRVEKLDLSKIYPPGKSGRLTFTVRDGGVSVRFQERSGSR